MIDDLAKNHEIPIVLDAEKAGGSGRHHRQLVTMNLKGVSLRSALRLMLLGPLDLTYMVKDEVLQITTPEDAESPEQHGHEGLPVGDLVVPIQNNSMSASAAWVAAWAA